MANPKVYADFHNADSQGRLRLNCVGTTEDLAEQQIELRAGLLVSLSQEAELADLFREIEAAEAVYLSKATECMGREHQRLQIQNEALRLLATRRRALAERLETVLVEAHAESRSIERELAAVMSSDLEPLQD